MGSPPDSAFAHDIRVTWGDCDPAKIAYTGRLPWFALDAINAWWERHLGGDGWFQMELDRNMGTPFVRIEMDFKRPVTPRHVLRCYVWPIRLGETSITFQVDAYQDGKLGFTGKFTNVFTVADQFRKQRPPEDIRALIEPLIAQAGA
ncbi:acyl-CoA thioesterase [Flavimaricola marinus]|uniref:Thioesterase superfamily protein n=1 Tax=Flavimaricola marinus TaxID=1819565 RepID=A0A238LBC6_9RHOB|nr:thioesterase family protein [Flavimaricola marinus]SMY06911.1 Thioesterase superfamily protein [Flavimaricola marinus]